MEKNYEFIANLPRGMYFNKKRYTPFHTLPFQEVKDQLPRPIIPNHQELIDCYWYAVGLAFKNVYQPTTASGFVSDFVDAAFNENIFMWDTVFISMFCNLFHKFIPGIVSLDNFYCKQFEDGEIPREIVRDTGKDYPKWVNIYDKPLYSYFHYRYKLRMINDINDVTYDQMYKPDLGREIPVNPYLTLDNLNHPLMAWAELVSYRQTGDLDRLKLVLEPLFHYYRSLWYHIRHANNLYVTDWAGMDNSPRNPYLGCAVDTSCEMVLFADSLLEIIEELEKHHLIKAETIQDRKEFLTDTARLTKDAINNLMWDESTGFYYDLTDKGEKAPVKTIAAFWALLSGVADASQAQKLADWLNDQNTFRRLHRAPVLAADEAGYDPQGGYWKGAVWAPTNTMVIYGLLKYGYNDLAKEIALNHLENVAKVFEKTGTIWENYPPDFIAPPNVAKKDFVGWSGIGPILYLIEFKIGLKADATKQEVTWTIDREAKLLGLEKYWFFGKTADFYWDDTEGLQTVTIVTGDTFNLTINYSGKTYHYLIDGDTTLKLA